MINEKKAKVYCSDDISLIENYHKAIADRDKMWDIHHRRECDSEGRTLFTKKQLIAMNLYYNRPAEELIFVTRSMHWKIHRELYEKRGKALGKIYGKIGGKRRSKIEKLSKPILQFSKDGNFLKEWPSLAEAKRHLGISPGNICSCCKGKHKMASGFIWKYKNKKA